MKKKRWHFDPAWLDEQQVLQKNNSNEAILNFYYDANKAFSSYVVTKLALSINNPVNLINVHDITEKLPGISFAFGLACVDKIIKPCLQNEEEIFIIDHAYFDRGYRGKKREITRPPNFRIIRNNLHPTRVFQKPPDRRERFSKSLHPWKKGGNFVLVCPPSGLLYDITAIKDTWLEKTISLLRKNTDMPILIRPKPGATGARHIPEYQKISSEYKNVGVSAKAAERPLVKILENAWACVAPASVASIEALTYGIPVFCEKISPAYHAGSSDYRQIESPVYNSEKREELFNFLGYCQFTTEEIENGFAFTMLKKDNYDLLHFIDVKV